MTEPDPEFDDFLKRRKPLFRAPDDNLFGPPADLDRVVLRQAREAIRSEQPQRMYSAPRWAAPVGLAATLVVGLAFVFRPGVPAQRIVTPEVTVQSVAQRIEYPTEAPAAPQTAPPPRQSDGSAPGDSATVALTPPMTGKREMTDPSMDMSSKVAAAPAWRRDSKTWLAEIERLRNAGDAARADAELSEYKRQQRAYAGAPDR